MNVQRVPIETLVLDPANARKHSVKNLEAIKGSLAKFGQQKPIVVGANNVVYAGNGTLTAAKQLGWTEISVVRTELEGAEAIAFALADNRTGELASWDYVLLGESLQALHEGGFDIGAIGFELPTLSDSDDEEEPEKEKRKKSVDCPQCGHHFVP